MKILHCPSTVCGNPHGISRAERELGHDSTTLAFCQNIYEHPIDNVIWNKSDPYLLKEFKRWRAIFSVTKKYDIIHYNSGITIAPKPVRGQFHGIKGIAKWLYNNFYARFTVGYDLKYAQKKNIITAITYQGSDARQGDFCRANYPIHFVHEDPSIYSHEHDILNRKMIQLCDKHADIIYAVNPDLLNVLPTRAKFIPYASVNPNEWIPHPLPDKPNDIPHIIHAPSNRTVKGTKYILDAFDRLKRENIPFRYTLVENMTNTEAKETYKTADLLVDQLLAGYYGSLSVELMALAKPVICYMRQEDLHYMPDDMVEDIPIINATPNTIYDVLKQYLTTDKSKLKDIGLKGRKYAVQWHDPIKITKNIIADYKTAAKKQS